MVDAALGTEIDVETVDGVITMKIPAGTQSGTDFKLSGQACRTYIVSLVVRILWVLLLIRQPN